MKNTLKHAAFVLPLFVGVALFQATPAASQQAEVDTSASVDFRMAPLEQAKKIFRQLQTRRDAGVTVTVMNGMRPDGRADRQHLILDSSRATPENIRSNLRGGTFDSVSWPEAGLNPYGSCDSDTECQRKTQELCKNAGHGGVKATSVSITVHLDGSKTCSGDCENNGAIAFVTCDPSR